MKNPFKKQWSVIRCKSLSDKGEVVKTFTGLFSWVHAFNYAEYCDIMERNNFIWGIIRTDDYKYLEENGF